MSYRGKPRPVPVVEPIVLSPPSGQYIPIASVTGINLLEKKNIPIYTVPVGMSLLITNLIVTVMATSSVSKLPMLRAGVEGDLECVASAVVPKYFFQVNGSIDLTRTSDGQSRLINDGKQILLSIHHPAEAEVMRCRVDLFGYLI